MFKKFAFGFILLNLFSSSFAADINDLDVGDGVYVQGFFSDELAYIKRIDYQRYKVKVARTSDGTAVWVSPSQIISREESIGNDVERGAVVITILACILNPEDCSQ